MRQKGFAPIIAFVLLALVIGIGVYLFRSGLVKIPASTPSLLSSPTPDPTANWKTYTNTAGYLIKYPTLFATQVLASGAGSKEATSTTRNLFIYRLDKSEPYVERYLNLEIFQGKPTYNQGVITEATLDNRTVEKIVIPDSKFDIYSVQLDDKEFIEIYVSNDPTKKEVADQILSTFKVLGQTEDITADWKVYKNDTYNFQIKYPEKFVLGENNKNEEFYDNLASLSYQNTHISIDAISNIDIYENNKPENVATREVMDGEFSYKITPSEISGYDGAITILENSSRIYTIAHPTRNLFIVISLNTDNAEFNQILSTFKFTQ